jgi:murein DD-endopeptidase MepM/ murein hydrolase activator NlpD
VEGDGPALSLPATRRALLALGAAALAAAPGRAQQPLTLTTLRARPVQGGYALVRTAPFAALHVDGRYVGEASAAGLAFVGFDRDAPPSATVEAHHESGRAATTLAIARGDFDIQRIGGLRPDTVAPSDPALLERIRRQAALKAAAFRGGWDGQGYALPFSRPVDGRVSARFGGQRVLNGAPSRPHYGVDLACPTGTPVRAPAAGRVALAEPDMHFEGGLVLLDHGAGLVTAYLHLSELAVSAGQLVSPGQRLAASGATGRATGPHLCWRAKWRDRNLDPLLLVS